jgi:hypothetical protein
MIMFLPNARPNRVERPTRLASTLVNVTWGWGVHDNLANACGREPFIWVQLKSEFALTRKDPPRMFHTSRKRRPSISIEI